MSVNIRLVSKGREGREGRVSTLQGKGKRIRGKEKRGEGGCEDWSEGRRKE